jgi:hypothetical protein
MKYIYMGREVEVIRFTANETAQLADGTWVGTNLLAPIIVPETQAMIEAVKRTKRSDTN